MDEVFNIYNLEIFEKNQRTRSFYFIFKYKFHCTKILFLFYFPGFSLGNVIALPVSGVLCENGFSQGWDSIFYVFGTFTCPLKPYCLDFGNTDAKTEKDKRRCNES